MIRRCAQYVTKNARRVPCDRPCMTFYCGRHGGEDAYSPRTREMMVISSTATKTMRNS